MTSFGIKHKKALIPIGTRAVLTRYHPHSSMPCGIHLFRYAVPLVRLYPSTLTGAGSGAAYTLMQGSMRSSETMFPLIFFTPSQQPGLSVKDILAVLFLFIAFRILEVTGHNKCNDCVSQPLIVVSIHFNRLIMPFPDDSTPSHHARLIGSRLLLFPLHTTNHPKNRSRMFDDVDDFLL